jgi:ATP-dependent RNA helicase RhlE
MWSEKLKLNKQLLRSVTEAGYLTPKEIQAKTLTRIVGGQDLIAIGPEGSGKTTAYVIGVLARLKYGVEEAPRALILVPDKDRVLEVTEHFNRLNKNDSIRIVSLYASPGAEAQMNALADGADIVVATPDRARAIYLKLGLNLNKVIMLVVDDAQAIVKQGLQLPVVELANSIQKCQHLVFTEVMHSKLELMIDPFMNNPAIIEVEELVEAEAEVYEQWLYNVPNFKTKINLLNLMLGEQAEHTKTVVFVNTRLTAEKLYNSLFQSVKKKSALLKPIFFESTGFEHMEDFKDQDEYTTLIVANELQADTDLYRVDTIIHFELPVEKETFIQRIVKRQNQDEQLQVFTYSTDTELADVKRIEQATGKKMQIADLPHNLIISKEVKDTAKKKAAPKSDEPERGAAFHEKKDSNNKNYNFSAGTKAKMNKKKKHG